MSNFLLTGRRFAFIRPGVRWLKYVCVLLFALIWVPMTSHCKLELIPGLEFLACKGGESKSHCVDGDTCCAFEKSGEKRLSNKMNCPLPPLVLFSTLLFHHESMLPDKPVVAVLTSPPELLPSWPFVSRAALPVRAPSVAS